MADDDWLYASKSYSAQVLTKLCFDFVKASMLKQLKYFWLKSPGEYRENTDRNEKTNKVSEVCLRGPNPVSYSFSVLTGTKEPLTKQSWMTRCTYVQTNGIRVGWSATNVICK